MVDVNRSQVFGDDAKAYDETRPDYPSATIDLIVQDGPTSAVDVGCGTGKAARAVAARGVEVLSAFPHKYSHVTTIA